MREQPQNGRRQGRYIAAFSKVSALKRTTEVVEHRAGDDSSAVETIPGRTSFEPITLERGITHDNAFERWGAGLSRVGGGGGTTPATAAADARRDLTLDVFDASGRKAMTYRLFRCWVSEFQALPDIDANANAIAIEHLILQNEGWERDTSVTEPTELPKRPPP